MTVQAITAHCKQPMRLAVSCIFLLGVSCLSLKTVNNSSPVVAIRRCLQIVEPEHKSRKARLKAIGYDLRRYNKYVWHLRMIPAKIHKYIKDELSSQIECLRPTSHSQQFLSLLRLYSRRVPLEVLTWMETAAWPWISPTMRSTVGEPPRVSATGQPIAESLNATKCSPAAAVCTFDRLSILSVNIK